MKQIVVAEGQSYYSAEQARVIASLHAYDADDVGECMETLGYYCCGRCGGYMAEVSGYSERNGVLCVRCAAEEEAHA